jgi:excisionase family DNA binding protein
MPKSLLSPEEVASILRVDPADVLALIEDGTLPAYRIGKFLRVAEDELDRCLEAGSTSGPNASEREAPHVAVGEPTQRSSGARRCKTFAGRSTFRISGDVETGAQIWPGDMRYPINFSKEKFTALLSWGRSKGEVRLGASFSGPDDGSLGQWIQQTLPTKMNPASYVAGLLIEEGYAEKVRPAVIRFFTRRWERQAAI